MVWKPLTQNHHAHIGAYEAMLEVRHVGTESCPVLAFHRKSRERRPAGAGCRAESRSHRATREDAPMREAPVIAIVDDDESHFAWCKGR